MKGDFTRDTFDKTRNISRVLMQQGRVQLDADFNEQAAILLHYVRTLARDLGGPHWGPADKDDLGFTLSDGDDGNFIIGPGRYYVDGILVENYAQVKFLDQESLRGLPDGDKDEWLPDAGETYYAYLDVWERHITHVQDERLREAALGGPDTCTRAQVVWQAKLHEVQPGGASDPDLEEKKAELTAQIAELEKQLDGEKDEAQMKDLQQKIDELKRQLDTLEAPQTPDCAGASVWLDSLPKLSQAALKARVQPERGDDDACSIPPESRYRGPENQLYRVEIHQGSLDPSGNKTDPTFKWSRDNGSVVFPIVRQQGSAVTVESLGSDPRTSLQAGDWVEIMDDGLELRGKPGILAQVDSVDSVEMAVTLKLPDDAAPEWPSYDEESTTHPLLRRWDHTAVEGVELSEGAIPVSESADLDEGWIVIEYGIEVQFQPGGAYRTGEYWLIPARVATGRIEWPLESELPAALPPHGVEHHYAPLGIIVNLLVQTPDCRCVIEPPACTSE